ncbi:hypothetical protein [Streptomyces luteolus]|uniref:Uncharacterized protein n=1 Tax=Streptomyces luteolus TaxID=3043615 RepID=A0ABT6T8N7_9ACTN|nr:hypothetical protein [Streptomyces sp. B-S-A12]MDI3424234.1 hypothetical protein [Streptomyces sp. B-S-A12]
MNLQHAELDGETDPEGEDVRRAEVGPLTVVYTVNRPGAHLYVLAVTWAG